MEQSLSFANHNVAKIAGGTAGAPGKNPSPSRWDSVSFRWFC